MSLMQDNNTGVQDISCELEEVGRWQTIVVELCSWPPDEVTRDCLQVYDASNLSEQIKQSLGRCCRQTLSDTLEYLRW